MCPCVNVCNLITICSLGGGGGGGGGQGIFEQHEFFFFNVSLG